MAGKAPTEAEKAYAEAERLIEAARRAGATKLDLSGFGIGKLKALDRIPDSIATLPGLTEVDLTGTPVTDLTPLAHLPALATLELGGTPVTDLTPLAHLPSLITLNLNRTGIADLTPLERLPALVRLYIGQTQVSNLTPLAQLRTLATLCLGKTPVTDLTALAHHFALETLGFDRTRVTDLTPLANLTGLQWLDIAETGVSRGGLMSLRRLRRLVSDPGPHDELDIHAGLRLTDCAATREDPRIAEIAGIKDPSERARALFEYLGIWEEEDGAGEVPEAGPPTIPRRRPAPLEVTVTDSEIRMAGQGALPQSDANDRAAMGWKALRDYRQGFARGFNIGNYQPLPAMLEDLDAAIGTAYDPRHAIRIGVQGERWKELAGNAAFGDDLPAALVSNLRSFASAIDRQVRRFPDWIAYLDDADPDDTSPEAVRSVRRDLQEVDDVLQTTPEAEAEVKREYAAEVAAGTGNSADAASSKAVIASTGEISREVADKATKDAERWRKSEELAKAGGDLYTKTVLGPMGMPLHVMKRLEKPLRNLSKKFPNRMGWIDRWYDWTFGPKNGSTP